MIPGSRVLGPGSRAFRTVVCCVLCGLCSVLWLLLWAVLCALCCGCGQSAENALCALRCGLWAVGKTGLSSHIAQCKALSSRISHDQMT